MPFSDLNYDVLRHIGTFLEPDYPFPWWRHLKSTSAIGDESGHKRWPILKKTALYEPRPSISMVYPDMPCVHWRDVLQDMPRHWDDYERLRAVSHGIRAVLPPSPVHLVLHMGSLPEGPDLPNVRRLVVNGSLGTTQDIRTLSEDLWRFLDRLPNLDILELDNILCPHKDYGRSVEDHGIEPISLGKPRQCLPVRILVERSDCVACAGELPFLLSSMQELPYLRRLKTTWVYKSLSAYDEVFRNLTTLVLKVMSPLLNAQEVVNGLQCCQLLEELFVSFYDVSRKVVVQEVSNPKQFRSALKGLPALHTLDMCLSSHHLMEEPEVVVPYRHPEIVYVTDSGAADSVSEAEDESQEVVWSFDDAYGEASGQTSSNQDGGGDRDHSNDDDYDDSDSGSRDDNLGPDLPNDPATRHTALKAAYLLAVQGIRRGWWWTRITDLDYEQLKGYSRLGWEASVSAGTGIVDLADKPTFLHPMVVWNSDGQGSTLNRPDERWG